MRGMMVAVMLTSAAIPGAAHAQVKPDPFTIEDNIMMGRSLPIAADKRVTAGPGVRGALQEVIGKPWFQLLGYCAGAFKFHMDAMKGKGDAAAAQAAENGAKQFLDIGTARLEADRAANFDAAITIASAEMEYGYLSAADGGETSRPFALDEARCRDVKFGYTVTFRPKP